MGKHVKWDVRNGGDGLTHVTRTEVTRTTKPDGTQVTRIETDHEKFGVTRGK
jgi:hypothetical protein